MPVSSWQKGNAQSSFAGHIMKTVLSYRSYSYLRKKVKVEIRAQIVIEFQVGREVKVGIDPLL